ncbi:hypothetical protein C2845_PM18G05660 [Panicum miliaceum]|uniref:Uncharacterized protein n=1 Tax=Panicum miliaceum TaxID=4540 RepID=A0A3L6PHU6_PANMI|nr:hypothetical protein C2845_PM18G05660 [Panicum miliaceum]
MHVASAVRRRLGWANVRVERKETDWTGLYARQQMDLTERPATVRLGCLESSDHTILGFNPNHQSTNDLRVENQQHA